MIERNEMLLSDVLTTAPTSNVVRLHEKTGASKGATASLAKSTSDLSGAGAHVSEQDLADAMHAMVTTNLHGFFTDSQALRDLVASLNDARPPGGVAQPYNLLMDDACGLLSGVGAFLEQLGLSVVRVTSGSEALNVLNEGMRFATLITDVACLDELGRDVIARASKTTPPIKTIILSDRRGHASHTRPKRIVSPSGLRGAL